MNVMGVRMVSEEDLEALLADRDPEVRELTRRARALLLELLPDAVQTCEGGDLGFGVGPGYKGLVFVLTPLKDAVRLGIAGGAALPDPHRVMKGAGKVHRHVRLESEADLARRELRDVLEAAVRVRKASR